MYYFFFAASTTSTTNRPSPPWLITSQPTVWRSTVPSVPKNPVQTQQGERKKPTVITPPTFRPHITLPPEVKLGDVGSKVSKVFIKHSVICHDNFKRYPEIYRRLHPFLELQKLKYTLVYSKPISK